MPGEMVDDLLDDELDALNDPSVEHLPEAPTLSGRGQMEEMYGEYAEQPLGRPSSPKLWAQASLFKNCQQLRVWKLEQGIPVGLGKITSEATEEDLIMAFPDAMPARGEVKCTFKLRPLDTNGREIGTEFTVHIGEHHAVIQQVKRSRAAANGGNGVHHGGVSDAQMQLLQRSLDLADRRTFSAEEQLKSERERLLERDHELARERVDLAQNAAQSVAAMSEQMMTSDAQRHEQSLETERARNEQTSKFTADFFSNQIEGMRQDREQSADRMRSDVERAQQRHDMEMERMQVRAREEAEQRRAHEAEADRTRQARRDREQREFEQRMERERRDWERRAETQDREVAERRRRDEEHSRARDSERQRQHERQMKEMDVSASRDREHAERMMQLSAAKLEASSGANVGTMLTSGLAFLKEAGIDPKDMVGMLGGGGDSGWAELLTGVIERAGGVAEKALEAKTSDAQARIARAQAAQAGRADMPPGYAMVPQQLLQAGALPQPGMMGPGGIPLTAEDLYYDDADYEADERAILQQAQQGRQPAQADADVIRMTPQQHANMGQPPPPQPPQQTGPALSLQAQKTARTAIRHLVGELSQAPEDVWSEAITMAIASELSIYHYANSVGVRRALAEAGAPDPMIDRVIAALKTSSAVPGALRYE